MTEGREYEAMVLDVLKQAVAEALERKRRLGGYAVMWREGPWSASGQMRRALPARRVAGASGEDLSAVGQARAPRRTASSSSSATSWLSSSR